MNSIGSILIARKITESKIATKPSVWIKYWLFLLLYVNWKDGSLYGRGQCFLNYEIAKSWFSDDELTIDKHKKIISFLKKSHMISTSRTPRGLNISIVNYDLYQFSPNFEAHPKAHQKHITSTSISKESNKVIIDKSTYLVRTDSGKKNVSKEKIEQAAESVLKHFNMVCGTKFQSTTSWLDNFSIWLQEYTIQDILKAIIALKIMAEKEDSPNGFWSSMTPIKLFRTKNKNGNADNIAELLNISQDD